MGDGLSATDVVQRLARTEFVELTRLSLEIAGVVDAVARHDTPIIYNWIVSLLSLQGVSDAAAMSFQCAHGQITWADVEGGLTRKGQCPSLRSWWHFRCGFRKTAWTCSHSNLIDDCGLPQHDLRKGVLNESAYGLRLFIRDICDGDLVAWIDRVLARADFDAAPSYRGRRMSAAVVEPLTEIPGTGPKLWSMILADLLLAGDPARERWVAAGAAMVAIDSLVHAWLHRTGTLRRLGREHAYGPRCYQSGGCVDVVDQIARSVDARIFNPAFPAYFPRFVQLAIWQFCAEGERAVCNGRQIDDRRPCSQVFCPAGDGCARRALHPRGAPTHAETQ